MEDEAITATTKSSIHHYFEHPSTKLQSSLPFFVLNLKPLFSNHVSPFSLSFMLLFPNTASFPFFFSLNLSLSLSLLYFLCSLYTFFALSFLSFFYLLLFLSWIERRCYLQELRDILGFLYLNKSQPLNPL